MTKYPPHIYFTNFEVSQISFLLYVCIDMHKVYMFRCCSFVSLPVFSIQGNLSYATSGGSRLIHGNFEAVRSLYRDAMPTKYLHSQ